MVEDATVVVSHDVVSERLKADAEQLVSTRRALWATVLDPPPSSDGRVPADAQVHTCTQRRQQIPLPDAAVSELVVVCGLMAQRSVSLAAVEMDPFCWDDVDACRFEAGSWILQSEPMTLKAAP